MSHPGICENQHPRIYENQKPAGVKTLALVTGSVTKG